MYYLILSKTYTDGAAFLFGEHPVIVYTDRYHRIDHFWFTLAHEIGHVVNHLNYNSSYFIDDDNSLKTDLEKEADRYANKILKGKEILDFFGNGKRISKSQVRLCSEFLNISEAIVVGTLHYNKKLEYSHLRFLLNAPKDFIPIEYRPEENGLISSLL